MTDPDLADLASRIRDVGWALELVIPRHELNASLRRIADEMSPVKRYAVVGRLEPLREIVVEADSPEAAEHAAVEVMRSKFGVQFTVVRIHHTTKPVT